MTSLAADRPGERRPWDEVLEEFAARRCECCAARFARERGDDNRGGVER